MRLFTCVNFSNEIKNTVFEQAEAIRNQCESGNFTRKENYHLTLVFLGEAGPSQARVVETCMDGAAEGFEPFEIVLRGIGRFRRGNGSVLWAGVEESAPLGGLYKALSGRLSQAGFSLENRPYTPHLTLAREAVFSGNYEKLKTAAAFQALRIRVDEISLMKSERLGGRLVYTELYKSRFQ